MPSSISRTTLPTSSPIGGHRGTAGRGIWYVLIAAVAWGTGGAAAAILYETSGLGPIAVSFWRFAGGVTLLSAAHLWHRRTSTSRTSTSRNRARTHTIIRRWRRIVLTGVGLAIYQTAYFAGVRYGGLAIATVVTLGAGPILIALGARFTLGERLGRAGLGSVAVALAGLLLLVAGGTVTPAEAPALGLACALLSALGYAAVTLVNRHLSRREPDHRPYLTLSGGFAVGLVCLAPLAVLEGLLPAPAELPQTLLLLAFLGAVPTALAYGLFFAALATVRATTASVLALIEPVTAAVIAAVLLDERLTVTAIAGGVVLLGAVAVLALGETRPSDRPWLAAVLIGRLASRPRTPDPEPGPLPAESDVCE